MDIIGNNKFLEFVDDLEKLEEIQFGKFEVGKDHVKIVSILPMPERARWDLSVPTLSPVLVRKKSLADEIAERVKLPSQFAALAPPKPMSECPPFPWSRGVYEARKTVFIIVPRLSLERDAGGGAREGAGRHHRSQVVP